MCSANGICVAKCDANRCKECNANGDCVNHCEACGDICVECPQAPATKTKVDGNPALCPGGIRREAGKDFSKGQCGFIIYNCGSNKTCKIKWCVSSDGKKLSIESVDGYPSCKIDKVVVKGANAANVYTFNPDAVCAANLVSPLKNGKTPEISHFDFCGIGCC